MGISGGPYIVRDSSLILELDAADNNSYPGSGTTCNDLASIGNVGTFTNSPTFNSSNGGNIVFNGTNSYIAFTNTTTTLANDNFTIDMWCRPTSTIADITESTGGTGCLSGQRFITEPFYTDPGSGAGVSIGTNGIVVAEHSNSYIPGLLEYTATISNIIFSHIVITYTSKQPRAYLNGVLVRTGLTSAKAFVSLRIAGIGGMQYANYGYFAGGLANIKWYNRTLSTDEILQNYNAQKSRFGL